MNPPSLFGRHGPLVCERPQTMKLQNERYNHNARETLDKIVPETKKKKLSWKLETKIVLGSLNTTTKAIPGRIRIQNLVHENSGNFQVFPDKKS